eukprot:COSAG04_NODE_4464_length_2073_cov_1.136272_4_plen_77_part_01
MAAQAPRLVYPSPRPAVAAMLRTEPVSAPRHMASERLEACMQRHMACKIKAAGHNTHTATSELRFIITQHTAVLFAL